MKIKRAKLILVKVFGTTLMFKYLAFKSLLIMIIPQIHLLRTENGRNTLLIYQFL